MQLYRRVRQGKPVADQPTSPLFAQLKLAGVVKAADAGRLTVRNRIYETVFTPEWAKSAMPADRGRQLAVATMAASLAGVLVWYAAFQPRSYEAAFQSAFQDDGYNTALEAYKALRRNPFSRSKATELMQQFWEQRGLRYAQAGQRDESLLSYLQGLVLRDSVKLRKRAGNLVGSDYERLRLTFRHERPVRAAAFSPDGQSVVTGSEDKTARIWDARSGKPLTLPLQHQRSVSAVAFSPDGRSVLTGSADNTARIWDARSGKPIGEPQQIQGLVWTLAFGPDGKILFLATDHWLNTYSWDGKKPTPLSSQWLHGFWKEGFRFPSDCESCLQVALGDTGNSFHLETLHLDGTDDPPLQGDPADLLKQWQERLGLTFDRQMKPVPIEP